MAIGFKFRSKEVEGLYYPCSENKGTDQFGGYREADLRLCFRICKKPFFHNEAHFGTSQHCFSFHMNLGGWGWVKITTTVMSICISFKITITIF